ncbi:hypothetical protein Mapa_008847 [Marchantia paleacea]|nr:hypothetical protein Mapa_008847 [Marchantia paleacea]
MLCGVLLFWELLASAAPSSCGLGLNSKVYVEARLVVANMCWALKVGGRSRSILVLCIAVSVKMSRGLLDLPRTFHTHIGAVGLSGKGVIQSVRCERNVLRAVPPRQEGFVVPASGVRPTVFSSFSGEQSRNAAFSVAALSFTRHSSVAVFPGSVHCGLEVLGKRKQCRCISEMPTEGEASSIEVSTSSGGDYNEEEESLELKADQPFFQDVQLDLKLPRRRMLVEFTCNVCNSRTQRLINPEAYKRGTVFVQCAGCEAYHQLVDNLNLIQEYDFRKDTVCCRS